MPIFAFCRLSAFYATTLSISILLVGVGCDKVSNETLGYVNAIDVYYSAHPACLWPASVRFPLQTESSDATLIAGYDALVEEGLLIRSTSGSNALLVVRKQSNSYDLSTKGHAAWNAESTQAGYGNFCYGHRKVSRIDTPNPTSHDPGSTTEVAYSYSFVDVPAWATTAALEAAFPTMRADVSGVQTAYATLTKTNNRWQVVPAHSEN